MIVVTIQNKLLNNCFIYINSILIIENYICLFNFKVNRPSLDASKGNEIHDFKSSCSIISSTNVIFLLEICSNLPSVVMCFFVTYGSVFS